MDGGGYSLIRIAGFMQFGRRNFARRGWTVRHRAELSHRRMKGSCTAPDMLRRHLPSGKQWQGLTAALLLAVGCSPSRRALPPAVIPHARWEATRPLGHTADAARRNRRTGDTLSFHDLTVVVRETRVDSSGAKPIDRAGPICACAFPIASRMSPCTTRETRRSSAPPTIRPNACAICRPGARATATGGMCPIIS